MTNASSDEFIAALESEFGIEGYGRWWKLLETIATQMDKTDRCFAEYPIEIWMMILRVKRRKFLDNLLEYCQNFHKLSYNYSGNILKISCPKLLELRDEYSRKSGQTPDTTPDKVAPDTDTDTESKKERIANAVRKSVSLEELSVEHIRPWLSEKRAGNRYLDHDEVFILEYFKNYCQSKNKKYSDYIAAYRNAFEWKACQPQPQKGLFYEQRSKKHQQISRVLQKYSPVIDGEGKE